MRRLQRRPLCLERLEDRLVPANVKFIGGTLFISPSAGEPQLALLVQQTAPNKFTVTDNGNFNGSYGPVSCLNITGGNGSDSIAVDVNGLTYTGSILISAGNGGTLGDDVEIGNSNETAGGIGGNILAILGNGSEFVAVGAAGQLTVGGSVTLLNPSGTGSAFIGNDTGNQGNLFPPTPGGVTRIGGDLTITGFDFILVGESLPDSVGGNLTISNPNLNIPVFIHFEDNFVVTKNVTITEGNGNDLVQFDDTTFNGLTTVTLGNGGDEVDLGVPGDAIGDGDSSGTTFGGNVSVFAGSGNDLIVTGPNVTMDGSLRVSVGSGDDGIGIFPTSGTVFPPEPGGFVNISGNVSISAGNGDDQVLVQASINGSLNFNLGNGMDSVEVVGNPGGKLNWTSGNGADVLALQSTGPGQFWNVNVLFGNNDDTFTLLAPVTGTDGGTISGKVDGGGRLVANVFEQDPSWTLLPTFQLINFP